MPFAQDEKNMATDAIASADHEPDDDKPSRSSVAKVRSDASFFAIYKKGQGKWTRLGTVIAAGGLGVLTAYNMYQYLLPYLPSRNWDLGICVGFLAVFSLLVHWLSNKPNNVDFLIATDSEMKKVNWTTQGELFGSTRVVVLFLVFVALFLFVVDLVFAYFFHLIRVLHSS